MTVELRILTYSVILGIVHVIAASHLISNQYGYAWTAGMREKEMPILTGVAGRVDRAFTNFLETFPFFAAVVLIASVLARHNALTIWGAYLYVTGRIAYVVLYAMGFGLLRSLVWNVALAGITLFLIAILI
jgi:uncharacterized MAPEG superfamily protein